MSSPSPFGQNEWLVEEMYRKFREDPSSVDPSWHEFLVDYSPGPVNDAPADGGPRQSAGGNGRPTAPPEPGPAPAPAGATANGARPAKSDTSEPEKEQKAPSKDASKDAKSDAKSD
ncbi:2-oxoglutarate dehydrogenase E1 subunit family protein, partial [Mycolicibacterium vaccae]